MTPEPTADTGDVTPDEIDSPPEYDENMTVIERFNNDPTFQKIITTMMMEMPTEKNEAMVRARRKEIFAPLWEQTDNMDREFVLSKAERRENEYIARHADNDEIDLPTWLLRMEAQDLLLKAITEGIEEEVLS